MSDPGLASRDLCEAIGLWLVSGRDPFSLVLSACDALTGGLDSPSLRELASKSKTDSTFNFPEIVERVLGELGLAPLSRDSDAARMAATKAKARQFLSGDIGAMELTHWAYRVIGYRGPPQIESLVNLDDEWHISRADDAVTQDVRDVAERLVAL